MSEAVWAVPEPGSVHKIRMDDDAAVTLRRHGNPDGTRLILCHGNGLPIEAEATGNAYRAGRDLDQPLLIGSVKTNIGHLESAAGAAALIKVLPALRRGVIPKHLNFRDPNPEIGWERLPLRVTAEPTPWPRRPDRPPLAGVSGFGWSGTNAHILVEGYGAPDASSEAADPRRWLSGPPIRVAIGGPSGTASSTAAAPAAR